MKVAVRSRFNFLICPVKQITLGLALSACASANGQSAPQTLDISMPKTTGVLGHVDAGALAETLEHLKAVGATPWTGMQGTGKITYGVDSSAYNATLTILGNKGFRLDGQTSKGMFSIRISRLLGKIQEADGHQYPVQPDTAATGIFQFQLPRLANFPDSQASLTDHGSTVFGGTTLRRLTYEFATTSPKANTSKPRTVATDLYFDSTTHLLVKSANTIHIDGAGNNDFLREITYEDYRQVGSLLIPFRYTQTLNGQKQWTLQLSDIQLNPNLQSAYFEF